MHRCLLLCACLLAGAGTAQASLMVTIDNLPADFTPGQSFTFEVHIKDALNLALYNIELVLSSPSGTPGVDFLFDPLPVIPGSGYVFPLPDSDASFLAAVNTTAVDTRLTLSDFNLDSGSNLVGVNTAPGSDLVALVTVATSASLTGPLSITIDGSSLILDEPPDESTGDPIPVEGFDQALANLPSPTVPAGSIEAIPEPGSLVLWGVGALGLVGLYRARRRGVSRV